MGSKQLLISQSAHSVSSLADNLGNLVQIHCIAEIFRKDMGSRQSLLPIGVTIRAVLYPAKIKE